MEEQSLFLFNTASGKKQEFTPLQSGRVNMYCCGPTVYNYAHIGNLRTYVFEDFLRRALEYLGYQVKHAVNITDVGHLISDADTGEDKMEKGARREGKSVWEIADFYTEHFFTDWKRLNLTEPTTWPRATDNITEQIQLVKTLEEKGYTYQADDGIYFDTLAFPRYGDFAHLEGVSQEAGIRVAVTEGKRNPTDFALWKFSPENKKRAMEWDSPWGTGFPGWHIECSAMAMKHLGDTLDIHCGGTDHIRVHHTNEIAQSECATGKTFSRFWVHGGWLLESRGDGPGKMSKSKEEFVRLDTLLEKGFAPMDYRYFCMTSHYRNYLAFSWENLRSARNSLKSLHNRIRPFVSQPTSVASDKGKEWLRKFITAVCDDLNIPQALAVLNIMLKDIDLLEGEKGALTLEFDKILGLELDKVEDKSDDSPGELEDELLCLIKERDMAREEKNFKRADEIRDIFIARGLALKDGPQGTTWEVIS
ncbi:cysteine--tRNA ligase [Fibrobacterota bacterium]